MKAKKKVKQGSAEWRRLVRKIFKFFAIAAKEGRLVLAEGVADDDSKAGLPIAMICEEFECRGEAGCIRWR